MQWKITRVCVQRNKMCRDRIMLLVLDIGGENVSPDWADLVLDVDDWQDSADKITYNTYWRCILSLVYTYEGRLRN